MTNRIPSLHARTYPPVPSVARDSRAVLRELLDRWELAELYESASLVLTELVSNAIRSEKPIGVAFSRRDSASLRVEVRDSGSGLPEAVAAEDDEESGRGLLLVGALAVEWGWRPIPDGKIVYAVLSLEGLPI
ncbi:ATP-binding protein [Actinocorallia aurantiaca]|uniref:Histidine kinase/HSP90-like ATPase domain-containing protein n=1 Tax=Actinocorallia aurantiaca TaxID=46204 RepID=A0ABP6GN01_9ACTN